MEFIPPDERALIEAAARTHGSDASDPPSVEELARIGARDGVDFATALLYARVRSSARHGGFIRRLETDVPRALASGASRPTVAVVPGAFYVERPQTGADGRMIAEPAARLGLKTDLIPLASFGHPAESAARILEWLDRRAGAEPIVLVSLSKGSAEVKLALDDPSAGRAFRRVPLWISLSGILEGTALVDWLLDRPLRAAWVRLLLRARGYSFAVLRDLGRNGPVRARPLRLPDHMAAVHVAGFPLQRHLSSSLARRGFRRIAPLGPNDAGGTLLAEVASLPGVLYPVWGADHYLRPRWNVSRLFDLLLACGAETRLRTSLFEARSRNAHEDSTAAARR